MKISVTVVFEAYQHRRSYHHSEQWYLRVVNIDRDIRILPSCVSNVIDAAMDTIEKRMNR